MKTFWKIDGEQKQLGHDRAHIRWEDQQFFTITLKGKKFRGEVLQNRMEEGLLSIKLNHRVYEIKKSGSLDSLIEQLGMDKPKVRKLKQLKAPMPGRVVNVAISVGDEISVGSPLLTLEAMKMENVLKAEGIGIVKSVLVASDVVVEKGSVLIEFE
jgi:biotin carboxyl carrier protein